MNNNKIYNKPDQNIKFIDFLSGINNRSQNKENCHNQTEHFVASHGMTLQHVLPEVNSKYFANGPRSIGPIKDGYPKRLLGGADSLGIDYKDTHPVISQKEVKIVDYSRVPKYNYPIPDVRL